MKMCNAILMIVMGALVGCTGMTGEQVGRTPAGDAVPASSVDPSTSELLPPARLIADPANHRFLVVTSDGQSAHALGKAMSCGCEGTCAPVALGESIGCVAGAKLQVSSYRYFPLAGAAAQMTDAQILASPELSISAMEPGTTRSCGTKAADFATVINRFAEDMLSRGGDQARGTRVLLDYRGGTAIWTAPRGLFPEYDPADPDRPESSVVAPGGGDGSGDDGSGTTCTCHAGSGCTKAGGGLKPTFCDAGGCTSCSISG